MDDNKMRILVLEPNKEPYTAEIENDFRAMQEVIGGYIEPIYLCDADDAVVFCNSEYLTDDSEANRIVDGSMVYGKFIVVGNMIDEEGENIRCSLTDEQAEKYTEMFGELAEDIDEAEQYGHEIKVTGVFW